MVQGQPVTKEGTGLSLFGGHIGAIVALLDRRTFGPVALPQLAFPSRHNLLGDHGMVEPAVIAGDEAAQSVLPVPAERPQIAA